MKKDRQKLWDFEPKKKRKVVNQKTVEKTLMVLMSLFGVGLGIYFLMKLIAFLLQ